MNNRQEKQTLPDRYTKGYSILSLVAMSGELPSNQILRLPGGGRYKEERVKTLKSRGLIQTYYKDKLLGYRLTAESKKALAQENPERFEALFTGDSETNKPKYEITRRLRLHTIAETIVTMLNAGVSVYRDEKPGVFYPDFNSEPQPVTSPAFYNSREIKELGSEFVKIKNARSVGVFLTERKAFIVYNSGASLLKWDYKSEMRTKALMKTILCRERLPHQYKPEDVQALMLGDSMERMYQILTSTGGPKRNYFILDGNYERFLFLTNDHNGEFLLKLLCDKEKTDELNSLLSVNLHSQDPSLLVENDAVDENGGPVLFAYDCDMPRITRFNAMLRLHGKDGTIICFDFQTDALRRYCGANVRIQAIDLQKLKGRFYS